MKLRAVLKWTGAGLCALIFAVWLISGCLDCVVDHWRAPDSLEVRLCEGRLWIAAFQTITPPGGVPAGWSSTCSRRPRPAWTWSCDWQRVGDSYFGLLLPLYIPFTLFALPTAWLFLRDQRHVRWAASGRCPACGYSLSGLPPGGACPECGKGVAA